MAIEMVVFDLAGTTVDDGDAVNRALREAMAAAGVPVDRDAVNAVMGLPKPVAIQALLGDPATERVATIHTDFVGRMKRFYETDPSVVEVEGTSRVFATLHRHGIKVALDTGFSRDITRTILDRLGWERSGLVDACISSDEVPQGRPHPDMIRSLMNTLSIENAESVVKVGDTPSDLEEGTNAGCSRVIGVTQGTHAREQMLPHPHTDLIATVADLPGLLGLD